MTQLKALGLSGPMLRRETLSETLGRLKRADRAAAVPKPDAGPGWERDDLLELWPQVSRELELYAATLHAQGARLTATQIRLAIELAGRGAEILEAVRANEAADEKRREAARDAAAEVARETADL